MVSNERLDRLDHLRFFACFQVLIFHFVSYQGFSRSEISIPFLAFLKEGHTGVAFFCTISGFILYWLYADRPIPYTQFIKRRLLRIAPLFLFVVMLAFVLDGTWTTGQLLAALTPFNTTGLMGVAAQGWSVLLEFQFYLLFPLLLLFTRRYGLSYLLFLIGLFLIVRGIAWFEKGTVWKLSYASMYGRADQFLAGMLTAAALKHPAAQRIASLSAWGIFAAGTVIIVLTCAVLYKKGGFYATTNDPLWTVLPTLEAAGYSLIIAGYLLTSTRAPAGKIAQFASYLGRISFSMYMTHLYVFPAIMMIGIKPVNWEQSLLMLICIGMPVLVLVSAATYRLIEQPFLELRPRETPAKSSSEIAIAQSEYTAFDPALAVQSYETR